MTRARTPLSRLQRTILILARRQYDLPPAPQWYAYPHNKYGMPIDVGGPLGPPRLSATEILSAHYGWPTWQYNEGGPYEHTRILGPGYVGGVASRAEYVAGHVAVSRALRRLERRGLLTVVRMSRGYFLLLTSAGLTVVKQVSGSDTCLTTTPAIDSVPQEDETGK